MDREIYSNVLDLLAFLLVTPDLYGKANMAQLSSHLLRAPRPSLDLLRFWRKPSQGAPGIVFGLRVLARVVALASFWVGIPPALYLGFNDRGPAAALSLPAGLLHALANHPAVHKVLLALLNILLIGAIGEGAALLICLTVLVVLFIFWTIGRLLGYIWATIGRLERIEGTMLAAGAVLFISARFVVLGPYLWQALHLPALLRPLTRLF